MCRLRDTPARVWKHLKSIEADRAIKRPGRKTGVGHVWETIGRAFAVACSAVAAPELSTPTTDASHASAIHRPGPPAPHPRSTSRAPGAILKSSLMAALQTVSLGFLRALLARDIAGAEAEAGAGLPASWPEMADVLAMRVRQLEDDPSAEPRLTRLLLSLFA